MLGYVKINCQYYYFLCLQQSIHLLTVDLDVEIVFMRALICTIFRDTFNVHRIGTLKSKSYHEWERSGTSFLRNYGKFNTSHSTQKIQHNSTNAHMWSIYSYICSNYQSPGQDEILFSSPSIIYLTTEWNPQLVLCVSRIIKTAKEKMNSEHWLWVLFTGSTDVLQSYYNKNEADETSAACEARFRSHKGTMW